MFTERKGKPTNITCPKCGLNEAEYMGTWAEAYGMKESTFSKKDMEEFGDKHVFLCKSIACKGDSFTYTTEEIKELKKVLTAPLYPESILEGGF